MNIMILTEANETVATGHLMEAVELAGALTGQGIQTELLINDNYPIQLASRIRCCFRTYCKDAAEGFCDIRDEIQKVQPEALVTDLRKIEDRLIGQIREFFSGKILCIDELGHRALHCDVLINPMADPYFWQYGSEVPKHFFGSKYLILPQKITSFHTRKKEISDQISQAVISMGGVDIGAATLTLMEWLPEILPETRWDIILGGGFRHQDQLEDMICKKHLRDRVNLYRNVNNIYDFFYKADLAFCAGGNTLHELACIGTPTITIPSMPHEKKNGKLFEQYGFGTCVDFSAHLKKEELACAVLEMEDKVLRSHMSDAGKRISDGMGCMRVLQIIQDEVSSGKPKDESGTK